jgi:PAS domain S-box-containing protein
MNESGQPSRMVGVNIDVTESKLAEQELSKANERLRLALEAGSAGGWDYDLKTGKDVWFGTAHAQLGMTPDETAGSRKEFWDRVHENDRERVKHALQVAKEKREDFAEDVRVVWRDGTTRWLRARGRFHYAANGEAERSLGISLDITERKMAEDRLREYKEALEGAEDMIGVIDRQYRFLLANRQYLRMRNLTREQVVGHFVTEVLNKDTFETDIKPKLDECFQGKVVRYEMKFSYPTVGERDLLLSYFPIEGVNRVDRVVCILRDITDRKRVEEALLEMNRTLEAQSSLLQSREDLLKTFVKNVPVGVAMLDGDMHYLQASDRWCADYSVDSSQILGRSHYELFPHLPQRWKEVHRRALEGEILRADEDRWDREGGPMWIRWEVRPWKTAEGSVGGILILAEDITRRKQMEEALSGMSGRLIEAHEQERTWIAREMHDDINQRLSVAAMELDRQGHNLEASADELRCSMTEVYKQISELSSDIHSLSHRLHSWKLDSLGLAAAAKSFCSELGERQDVEVNFSSERVPRKLPEAISLCLFRVLQEALQNAVKHSGVRHFGVSLVGSTNQIALTVCDEGRGFCSEEALLKGGLGLTSMKERLNLVGGKLDIDVRPSRGTIIRAFVPLKSKSKSVGAGI